MMDKNETGKSAEEQAVDDHRNMLMLTGNLSDFQLENLKKWPFVVFGSDIKKTEIAYDFRLNLSEEDRAAEDEEPLTDLKAGSVEFDFYFKKGKMPDQEYMEKALSFLEIWSKFMFWQDTEVYFKVEGKKWGA